VSASVANCPWAGSRVKSKARVIPVPSTTGVCRMFARVLTSPLRGIPLRFSTQHQFEPVFQQSLNHQDQLFPLGFTIGFVSLADNIESLGIHPVQASPHLDAPGPVGHDYNVSQCDVCRHEAATRLKGKRVHNHLGSPRIVLSYGGDLELPARRNSADFQCEAPWFRPRLLQEYRCQSSVVCPAAT